MGHVDALSRCHEVKEAQPSTKLDLNQMPSEPKEAHDTNVGQTEVNPCRIVAAVDTDDIDFRLQVTQGRDPLIAEIRNQLGTEEMNDYAMIDGLVYRISANNDVRLL